MSFICRRLSVDPTDGHRDITGGHGRANFLAGDDAIQQTLDCTLKFLQGEWFLNASEGIPYMPNANATDRPIMGRFPADTAYAEAVFKAAILSSPGINSITTFSLSFDHTTRALVCQARGVTMNGGPWAVGSPTQ